MKLQGNLQAVFLSFNTKAEKGEEEEDGKEELFVFMDQRLQQNQSLICTKHILLCNLFPVRNIAEGTTRQ